MELALLGMPAADSVMCLEHVLILNRGLRGASNESGNACVFKLCVMVGVVPVGVAWWIG